MALESKNYNPDQMASGVNLQAGAGVPSHSAPKGTLYLNLTGSAGNNRAYINTDGATTWTAITTAA
jgi:hypothetical protein